MTTAASGVLRCKRMIANDARMVDVLRRAAAIAATDASVILTGESGTGKDVVARLLHANSRRHGRPFVAVNVSAIPDSLLESELFGHAKGAFTGAVSAHAGLMEAAHGGTLFLDEIAELPLALQPKLLRALQDGEVRRVGDSTALHVDVRLICATHQDLEAAVAAGRFRADLYYRIKVFVLRIPPLRERPDDILALARAVLERDEHHAGLTPDAERILLRWHWPGNVRELCNAMIHGAVLARGAPIDRHHLPEDIARPALPNTPPPTDQTLDAVSKAHVLRVLEQVGGHHADAARILGIGRTTLWRKLRDWGIDDN